MLIARGVVGLGEAAYAAAGAALLAHTFPIGRRAAVQGAFQSAALFGSVLGVVIGEAVAAKLGWRYAFFLVGAPGLLLAALYPFVVRDYQTVKLDASDTSRAGPGFGQIIRRVFGSRCGNLTFVAFGLQMGIPAILISWTPTLLNRFYGFEPQKAALMAAVAVLAAGVGVLFGGGLVDRLSKGRPRYRALVPAAYALISGLVLFAAFSLPTGPLGLGLGLGLGLVVVGALFAAAQGGSSVAIVMDVTHPAVHATVTAVAVLGTNLLGLAPGPYVVGLLSDMTNLKTALAIAPMASVVSALLFVGASRYYERDVAAIGKGDKGQGLTPPLSSWVA